MEHPQLAKISDSDERRWAIEDAARTLQSMARLTTDPELMKEAQKEVDRLAEEAQEAKRLASALTEKSQSGFVHSVNSMSAGLQENK